MAYRRQRFSQVRKVLLSSTSDVYDLLFKVPIENKLKSFQFKLLRNIIHRPSNQRLWKMNLKTFPQCEVTFLLKLPIIIFLRVSCRERFLEWYHTLVKLQTFWKLNTQCSANYMVTSRNQHAFTLFIINLLTARCYVHLPRSKLETPRLDVFIVLLKTKIHH